MLLAMLTAKQHKKHGFAVGYPTGK